MANRNIQKKEDILIDTKNRKIAFSSWIPQKTNYQLIIVHGLSEHRRCYEKTALTLAEKGIASHALDLPGHGFSDGARGHIEDFQEYIDNVALFFKSYPNFMTSKPTFLLGHSLGGLISAHFVLQNRARLKGLILSSPLFGLPLQSRVLGQIIGGLLLRNHSDVLIPKPSSVSTLSRNPKNWEKYRSDPLRLHTISPALYSFMSSRSRQMVRLATEIDLPVLTFYSMADRVVSPDAIHKFMRNIGSLDKEQVVFTRAMHELFQEEEQPLILEKMITWMKERG